jgi:uncharacterized membrane protein
LTKSRLEAFSDGVLAVIITIMVLELKPPHGTAVAELRPMIPTLLCYVLSFVMLGIYWNNHHHMLHASQRVSGGVLWANLHLLFWLSLVPFVTAWMGENHLDAPPVALYGGVLLMAGVAYYVLARSLIALHGRGSTLAKALGTDVKGRISVAMYGAAIPSAFLHVGIALALYVAVAVMWLVPDRRIERALGE